VKYVTARASRRRMFNKGKDKANSNKMHNLEIVLAQQDL
jgi:hypothetical protein